jgi:hypothetical protein
MKILLNGEEISIDSIDIRTIGVKPVKPPVDDKPPVRPVEPTRPVSPNVVQRNLGTLKGTSSGRKMNIPRGKVLSFKFTVDSNKAPSALIFSFAPQNSKQEKFIVTVSSTPGGKAIGGNAQLIESKRRGDQMQLWLARRDMPRRGQTPYDPGKTYYLNIRSTGSDVPLTWGISGAFKR